MAKANLKSVETTRIDIEKDSRARVAELLNKLLADASDLTMQSKHAHWNVKGPHFPALHTYFDELHEAVGVHIDEIAERTAALGAPVRGRLSDAARTTRLKEFPDGVEQGMDVVRVLADSVGAFANSVREGISTAEDLDDMVSADMLTGIAASLDKHLWFLEAHLR